MFDTPVILVVGIAWRKLSKAAQRRHGGKFLASGRLA